MPNYSAFHKSVSEELYSVKDRIRNLVEHWPTDGESKEIALRSVLRRHLPESVILGRGFVVTPSETSTQIDILIVDASKPALFKDGDLLIVTPDAVKGIVEVKSELGSENDVKDAATKLAKIKSMCFNNSIEDENKVWAGMFVFSDTQNNANFNITKRLLGGLYEAYKVSPTPINCISFGKNLFLRHWNDGSILSNSVMGSVYHSYNLQDVSPSYFMGNLIDSISSVGNSSSGFAWFPKQGGKEQYRTHYLSPNEPNKTIVSC
jgi:hypothetical protein